MAKYRIDCECGRQMTVETAQAGETLRCECGRDVVVPTLRQLRQLPQAQDESTAVAGPTWGLRQAAITASLLAALVCLALAAVSRFSEHPVPTLDPTLRTKVVDQQISGLTPVEAWRVWVDSYRGLAATGFEEIKHPATAVMQQELNWHRAIQKTLVSIAAACAVGAVVLALAGRGKPAG